MREEQKAILTEPLLGGEFPTRRAMIVENVSGVSPDSAALDATFPSHAGMWYPDGAYLHSAPWSVRIRNEQWAVRCCIGGVAHYEKHTDLCTARDAVLQQIVNDATTVDMVIINEVKAAEERIAGLRRRRAELASILETSRGLIRQYTGTSGDNREARSAGVEDVVWGTVASCLSPSAGWVHSTPEREARMPLEEGGNMLVYTKLWGAGQNHFSVSINLVIEGDKGVRSALFMQKVYGLLPSKGVCEVALTVLFQEFAAWRDAVRSGS